MNYTYVCTCTALLGLSLYAAFSNLQSALTMTLLISNCFFLHFLPHLLPSPLLPSPLLHLTSPPHLLPHLLPSPLLLHLTSPPHLLLHLTSPPHLLPHLLPSPLLLHLTSPPHLLLHLTSPPHLLLHLLTSPPHPLTSSSTSPRGQWLGRGSCLTLDVMLLQFSSSWIAVTTP